MYTIWFFNTDGRYELLTLHNLRDARKVYHSLELAGFEIKSACP